MTSNAIISVDNSKIALLQRSASNKHPLSQYQLALAYIKGKDIEQNYDLAIDLLTNAADSGLPEAQYYLGNIYYEGALVDQDLERAQELFSMGAHQKNPGSQCALGLLYKDGPGNIQQNYEDALHWLEKAGQNNYSKALYTLGEMYLDGEGVEKDFDKAFNYLVQASRLKDEKANYLLGIIYYEGKLVTKNYKIASNYFTQAQKHNHADSIFMLGEIYFEENNKIDIESYKKASDLGSASAQYKLGKLYFDGIHVEKDLKSGISLIEKSAKNNNSDAQYELSNLYFLGQKNLLNKDSEKAMHWLTKAANANHNPAKLKLGNKILGNCNIEADDSIAHQVFSYLGMTEDKPLCQTGVNWIESAASDNYVPALIKLAKIHLEGKVIEKDKVKAVSFLETATEQNSVDSIKAYHLLGKLLLEDDNANISDFEKAIAKLERAAEKGNLDSSYILGTLYLEGQHVEKDYDIALKHFMKASDAGHGNSQYALAKIYFEGNTHLKQNCNKAIGLFEKSIEPKDQDSHISMFVDTEELIGDMYRKGCIDLTKDIGSAMEWYTKGDKKNNANAQYKLFEIKSELEAQHNTDTPHEEL
jgi:hypothetical protein